MNKFWDRITGYQFTQHLKTADTELLVRRRRPIVTRKYSMISISVVAIFMGIMVSACSSGSDKPTQNEEPTQEISTTAKSRPKPMSRAEQNKQRAATQEEAAASISSAFLTDEQSEESEQQSAASLIITSSALPEGEHIPNQYTCNSTNKGDDEDVSPPLQWSNVPKGTRSFALIFDDPDAIGGTFVHWVVYNIPPGVTELKEALPATGMLANGAKQGVNDFGNLGYGGPCPPPAGKIHACVFKLYAIDIEVSLGPGATKAELVNLISNHILNEAVLERQYRKITLAPG